jgi:hypothetical protein
MVRRKERTPRKTARVERIARDLERAGKIRTSWQIERDGQTPPEKRGPNE